MQRRLRCLLNFLQEENTRRIKLTRIKTYRFGLKIIRQKALIILIILEESLERFPKD